MKIELDKMTEKINQKQWENWNFVEVFDYDVVYNAGNRPLYPICFWCNNYAIKVIKRQSKLSKEVYENYICEIHLKN